jgi:E3 SUMO-protein ligase RanBP2
VKKDLSQLSQFKPKSGSWECPGCLCRNESDTILCPACQTVQPGKEEEAKSSAATSASASSFKFNSGPAVSGGGFNLGPATTTTAPTSGFKFGTGTSIATPTTPASGFTFGAAASASSTPVTSGFSFGGKPAETKPAAAAAATPPSSGFSFGVKQAETIKPVETISPEKPAAAPVTASTFSFAKFGALTTPAVKPEPTEPAKPSPFSGFSFGSKTEEVSPASKGVDLSASKNLASFADLATTPTTGESGFGFGAAKSNFSFSGAGAPVFGQGPSNKKEASSHDNADDDDGHVEGADHDPHFEPIIPLPELVQVMTGEEEEEELFKHKAKCYR